jgi:hypothetical protein
MKRALPLLVLGLMACNTHQGDGTPASEVRELADFQGVRNDASIPLLTEVGPATSVEVFCDENLLEFIQTEIHNGTLTIEQPPETVLAPAATCEVMVTTPLLERVQAGSTGDVLVTGDLVGLSYARNSGWGDIVIDGIDSRSLRLISEGRGGLFLAGVVDATTMDSSGAGGIAAADLTAATAFMVNSGSGDITATVTDHATVRIEGDGDVVLLGDPESVEVEDAGCGDVY